MHLCHIFAVFAVRHLCFQMPNKTNILRFVRVMFSTLFFHMHFSAIVLYLVISHCCHVHCILCGVSFIILVDVGFIERVYDLNKVKNIYSLFRRNSHNLNYLNQNHKASSKYPFIWVNRSVTSFKFVNLTDKASSIYHFIWVNDSLVDSIIWCNAIRIVNCLH